MTDVITVSIDGMGGDNAPDMIIGGIELACIADSSVDICSYLKFCVFFLI